MPKHFHCHRVLTRFVSYLGSLEKSRQRVEQLASANELASWDVERLYEALFLSAFAHFEVFVEEVFFSHLLQPAPRRLAVPRVSFQSASIAREIVFRGVDYLDWLPWKKTEALATLFFRKGRPFVNLDDADRSELKRMLLVRNAIAHRGSFALQQFQEKVVGSTAIPPREKIPARFLRGTFRTAPVETRFENYIGIMGRLARKLSD